MPDLVDAYLKFRDQGFVLVAVDLREGLSRVQAFADEFDIPYPIVLDRRGEVAGTWRIGGPNEGVPASYFIDRDGVVRKVVFGTVSPRTLDENISLILQADN
jgi:peroxiredoxin